MNSKKSVIVYIDYDANFVIVNQTKFTFSNVNKLNLKLIRVSMYLFQFRLKNFHRSRKFNIVSNALNQLLTIRQNLNDEKIDSFDINNHLKEKKNVIQKILIQMFLKFRRKLNTEYEENSN